MSKGYFTIKNPIENVIVIERSKFICNIKSIENEDDAKAFIESIRKKYSLANHNCYAYIADDKGLIQKFSDDGEPQGTAGLPMLEVLKNKKMHKTVAVVTRFFGGIKLGTGGLTRAYGGSVTDAISLVEVLDMQEANYYFVAIDYEGYSKLIKILSSSECVIVNTEFENQIKVDFAIKVDSSKAIIDKIVDAFNGKIDINFRGCDYFAFK